MKVYVVINVIKRIIFQVGAALTLLQAIEIMKTDFMDELENAGYTQEDFENGYDQGVKWGFDETEAWLNSENNYNWRIIEVDIEGIVRE